jgi:hypothetical protein
MSLFPTLSSQRDVPLAGPLMAPPLLRGLVMELCGRLGLGNGGRN